MENIELIEIENRIFTIRGVQVMIDKDLAELYEVGTKVLNQSVKRNIDRFPYQFRFQLSDKEKTELVTNCDRFANLKHSSVNPYAFTEQGVAMLSAVLRSETAIKISIKIMQAFVEMRKLVLGNAALFQRLDRVELKQIEADQKFEHVFKALESRQTQPEKGIFYDGQVFDAWTFVKTISKQLKLDAQKHNTQYEPIEVKQMAAAHDRFLIIDETTLYHIGASLKDLGKKWFAFSKMDTGIGNMLNLLKIKSNE